ncbi:MAG: hypothetical protein FWG10_13555 [Eubacteriaceae bacterium]|nr:hypothetical protein [Eubacteriaceae bacterium]
MIRRIVLTMFSLVLVLSIAGCSSGDSKDHSGSQIQNTGEAQADKYEFVYKGTTITMKAKAGPILEAIGEHNAYYEAPSCAFEGLDKTYSYSGFDVVTYTLNGVDYINSVVLMDDTISTPEGIAIGSNVEAIKSAYEEASAYSGPSYTIEQKDTILLILTDNAVATSIQYIAITE